MSQFNKKLDEARIRQKRLFWIAGMLSVAIILLVVSLFVVSRGTRVEISPEEASEIAEIEVSRGAGFSLGSTVYSFFGNPEVSASAPGYKETAKTIDSQYLGKVFPLQLFELPGRLIVELAEVRENGDKTRWRIDEREVAISTILDIELEPGQYSVEIDNDYYQPEELEVELERGEKTELQVKMQPVEGVLNLSSNPQGASVSLDNTVIGKTPLQYPLEGGEYELKLSSENHIEITEKVAVTRTTPEVWRNYNLELKKAEILAELNPKGGTFLVNGVQMTEPFLVDATVEHRLTYLKPGYYSSSQMVTLAAGEKRRVEFNLKEERGRVEIFSTPRANIIIGDKDYGLSPVNVELRAVNHRITFKKQGYRSISKTVKPKGGTSKQVSATLLTEYQARLQEVPRQYTNSAGIKLQLFLVNDRYTMGAPRSEKGQRANEFQREVMLTKPFYASLHEITRDQFARFTSQKIRAGGNTPVTMISWQEAAIYCNLLSMKEKLQPFYLVSNTGVMGFNPYADGYRLLSEAEWEWLARKAGKRKQTIFSWGNDTVIPPNAANIADERAKGKVRFFVPNYKDGYAALAPVGSLQREPSGLYDLAGNVSEWVHDVYSIIPPATNTVQKNPLGSQRGKTHVVKGANFRSGTITTLRPAFREGLEGGRDDVGFRIGRYLFGGEND